MTLNRRSVLVAAAVALLPGCGSSAGRAGDALGIVVGGHANSAPPGMVDGLGDIVLDALSRDTAVAIVTADGRPAVTDTFRLRGTARNSLTVERERRAALDRVGAALTSARARTAEVDLLAALALAARSVAGAPGLRRIVVLDSGLQTAGALRFQSDGGATLDADPEELAERLAQDGEVPDLRGIEVVLAGIGDVVAPQLPLGEPGRRALLAIWSAIVVRAGGVPVPLAAPTPARPMPVGLPPVTVVPVPAPPPVDGTWSRPIRLGDASVGFLPDVAQLRDPAGAAAVVAPYADALRASGRNVRLTGTTSSAGTPRGRVALSLARAAVVRDLLVAAGVGATAIEIRGLGSDFPGFVPDRDTAGRLDPVLAARNRQVIIDPVPVA